jgi:hypothetical protein
MQNEKPIVIAADSWPLPGSRVTEWRKAIPQTAAMPEPSPPGSTAERWVHYVLGACRSEKDPRTLAIWAREVAVSYTTLCESCRLMNVRPRQARDFARVLRIILMPSFDASQLAIFFDISDRRTLDSLLRNAGLPTEASPPVRISVFDFLDNQHFIPMHNPGLNVLRELLFNNIFQNLPVLVD